MTSSPDLPLTIRLFGTPEVLTCGVPIPRLRTRKGLWLLALLVLRPQAEVEREWLAATLWPHSPERTGLTNLRNVLMDLRRALGPQADRLGSPTTRALRLDMSGAQADVLDFDTSVSRGDSDSLQRAVSLYRGPLLEACAEEWVFMERESREQAYLGALEALATHAMAASDPEAAERHLRRVVAMEPLRETAQRGLIQALAAGGNHAAALLAYRKLRLQLRRELGAEPDPQTLALVQRIRADARRDVHALRNGRAPTVSPNNLPAQLSSFVGREAEVARLRELVSCESARLLTLTGPGGSGKTRLGLRVAADLLSAFPDGVFFVDLAPIRDPCLVVPTIAQTLGVEDNDRRPLGKALAAYLDGKRMLLLLDNFEQVLEAAVELPRLLTAAPSVMLIVTSRAVLRLRGEQEFPVPPLPVPAAVELFVQRAMSARPDFRSTDGSAPAVAKICVRLDGLPLAIELAAARTKLFSPQALLSRLQNGLQELTGGARDLPARQKTLRDTIAWSYDLLDERGQQVFRRLSVFVGGFTLEAGKAVCSENEDVFVSLIDQSLLHGIEEPGTRGYPRNGSSGGGESRFAMLETLRDFAAEQLALSGESEAVRWGHARYFLAFAQTAGRECSRRGYWLDRLEAEHDNLRAVLTWATERSPATDRDRRLDLGLRLGAELGWFWNVRGHASEARERLRALLGLAGPETRTAARAAGLNALAGFTERPGEYRAARALMEESLAIRRELQDRRGMAGTLYSLGRYAQNEGDEERARNCFEESLALSREPGGDSGITAANLLQFGEKARDDGDFATAHAMLEESLAIRQEMGDQWMVANALQAVGRLSAAEGKVEEARTQLEESLRLMRELGARGGSAFSLEHLGRLCLETSDLEQAARFLREALAIRLELGDPRHLARGLRLLADLTAARGQAARAARLLGAAEGIACAAGGGPFATCTAVGSPRDLACEAALRLTLWEEAFAVAWAEGRDMTLEQAAADAPGTRAKRG